MLCDAGEESSSDMLSEELDIDYDDESNSIFPYMSKCYERSPSVRFFRNTFMSATCPAHRILLDLIILKSLLRSARYGVPH
jgi:hypothetical protein